MTGIVVLSVTLLAGALIGLVTRRRSGVMRPVRTRRTAMGERPMAGAAADTGADSAAKVVTSEDLGGELGERATLVQFSTAFCQPCRATRRVLADVAEMVSGVRHVEIDAEARLDLVRRFDVMRTPTVFVLDAAGHIVKRASGQPRKADVIAAIGAALNA